MKKLLSFFAVTGIALLSGCSAGDDQPTPDNPTAPPTVTTAAPVKVNDSTYTCGGNVTAQGAAPVTGRGVVVSLDPNPSLDDPNDVYVAMGTGTGAFSLNIHPFYAGYTYHLRAYAKNANGVAYGGDVTVVPTGGPVTGCPVVPVTGNITTPTRWTTGKVYLVEGNVKVSSVLTIEPGTIVKMKNARLEVISSGKILANGTASGHIVFTSYADDSYCGDSNGDGSATTAQKGDWYSIYLNGGTGNTFTYCDVLYAGKDDGGYYNAVLISVAGPSFTFDHCTFAHTLSNATSSAAFAFNGQSYMSDASVSIFTNNVFYDNDRPIYMNDRYNLGTTNSFHNPANPSEGNKRNGIFLSANGGDANVSYLETEVPFVEQPAMDQGTNGSLTIGAGVIVKFMPSSGGYYVRTNRPVNVAPSAIITSYRDDAHGGDTNGDGSATSPATGDWEGIYNTDTRQWINGGTMFYARH